MVGLLDKERSCSGKILTEVGEGTMLLSKEIRLWERAWAVSLRLHAEGTTDKSLSIGEELLSLDGSMPQRGSRHELLWSWKGVRGDDWSLKGNSFHKNNISWHKYIMMS